MLEYQGSWHFCWKIHGTKTRYKWQAQWDEITCNACKTAMKAEYVGSWSRKFSPYAERLCSNLVLQKDHYAKIIVPGNSQCQRIVLWLRDHLQSSKYWRLLNSAEKRIKMLCIWSSVIISALGLQAAWKDCSCLLRHICTFVCKGIVKAFV